MAEIQTTAGIKEPAVTIFEKPDWSSTFHHIASKGLVALRPRHDGPKATAKISKQITITVQKLQFCGQTASKVQVQIAA